MLRNASQRSIIKGLYAGSIFIATTILFGIADKKEKRVYKKRRESSSEESRKAVDEAVFFSSSRLKISEPQRNTGRSRQPPVNPT
jgi:hypothetical protein